MLHPLLILTDNRNIGVLQTTVAEVVTVEAHQGQQILHVHMQMQTSTDDT